MAPANVATTYVVVSTRASGGRRPHGPPQPAATIHRLHRDTCRYAPGPASRQITLEEWASISTPDSSDHHLPCRLCRPVRSDPELGWVYQSRSGRRWRVIGLRPCQHMLLATVMPLGSDCGSGGGVKSRDIDVARLIRGTHGWRRLER